MSFLRSLFLANNAEYQAKQRQLKGNNRFETARRLSGYSWLIILLTVLLIASLWSFVWHQINSDYNRTIGETYRETTNLAIAFEEHVRRILIEADNDLLNLKQYYEWGGKSDPAFAATARIAANDSARSVVAIFDEKGTIIAASIQNALGAKRPDREYFQIHHDYDSQKLYIGRPMIGRIDGVNTIPLTRRINNPDGSFGGIVYIGLRSDYLLDFYQKMNLGEDQLITLVGLDGIVRARQSGVTVASGQDMTDSTLWKHIKTSPNGTYMTRTYLDGIPRILSYRLIPDYPLAFVIGKATKEALSDYEQRKQYFIIGALSTSFFIVISSVLLVGRAENQRKRVMELEKRVAERTQELQQERDRLSALFNCISEEVWFADTEKRLIIVNPAGRQEFLLSSDVISVEELASGVEILRPDGTPRPIEETPILRALQGEVIKNQQVIMRTPSSGQLRHRESSATPVRDAGGNIIGSVNVVRDITERKAMEDELVKYRDHLETLVAERTQELESANKALSDFSGQIEQRDHLLNLTREYIIVSDAARRIIFWNGGAQDGYGWTVDEAVGQVTHDLFKTKFPRPMAEITAELFQKGYWHGELIHQTKNGTEVVVDSYWTLKCDKAGIPQLVLEVNHDITEQRKMHAEMARLDRLNLIGEMAASIGHEIRNPLTSIRGYLQFFQRKDVIAEYRTQFQTMIDELDRANGIISEFLSLAKNKTIELKPHNLNNIIRALLPLLQSEALRTGHDIQVNLGDVPDINLDEKEMRQLILNLARNGIEAMEVGGMLTIETYAENDNVVLAVRDTGTGIPKAVLDKLGTPFLTTKDKGTGLGLPVCYRIAEHHGAKIGVATGLAGTTFSVMFSQTA